MKAIVAVDKNWSIGKDNQLLFKIPEDMKFFRNLTTGNIVVMGSKTFESIGKPLPNRVNMILTRLPRKYGDIENVEAYSKDDMERILRLEKHVPIFIIGGESVYNLFIDEVDEIYVTKLEKEYDADKHFINLEADHRFKKAEDLQNGEYEGSKFTISRWIRA
jgi:dihydrofolate reductase